MISAASWESRQNNYDISFLKEDKDFGKSTLIDSPKKFNIRLDIFIYNNYYIFLLYMIHY